MTELITPQRANHKASLIGDEEVLSIIAKIGPEQTELRSSRRITYCFEYLYFRVIYIETIGRNNNTHR